MNQKGFAISGMLYTILIIFLVLLFGILGILGSRKVIFDKTKKEIQNELNDIAAFDYVKSFGYTGDVQTFVVPKDGVYQVELWGARGGSMAPNNGGNGAFTKGTISLRQNEKLFIYIGGKGSDNNTGPLGGYNGGGSMTAREVGNGESGGGATDLRLTGGLWNDFSSLKSRIMVAGGGGGANHRLQSYGEGDGGAGGTMAGLPGKSINHTNGYGYGIGLGGTQVKGGLFEWTPGSYEGELEYAKGLFGLGGDSSTGFAQSGGGSGYYGGGPGSHGGAGGGSSFISGYPGCDAITEGSTSSNIIHTGQPNHYSGKVFDQAIMKSGNELIPNPSGGGETVGNTGNGYARITFLHA